MLTDNSLGKLFLEHEGILRQTIENQSNRFTPEDRRTRDPKAASSVEELCTYLVGTEEEGEGTDFDHPREIRVLDPACGSGHFLLYAFDVLERIWWAMEPAVSRSEIPEKILRHNLYGIDLDLRACQLAAFNLYLKARSRAEEHGGHDFEMPSVGIACSDVHVADLDVSHEVFDEVAGDNKELRGTLNSIVRSFERTEGLGSLLDVKGTLADLVEENGNQLDAFADEDTLNLPRLLDRLRKAVTDRVNGGSFRAKDIRSFLRLLMLLTQDYDVSLMNPPYGSRSRMPSSVKGYVKDHYRYYPEFYINFFEICDRLSKEHGRVGMLVPRSFMFKTTFQDFREEFISGRGAFDFLAELGDDVLDNAKVRTAGTVVNVTRETGGSTKGSFFRVHDVDKEKKEEVFLASAFDTEGDGQNIQRRFERPLKEFEVIPGSNLSYWVPLDLRSHYTSDVVLDAENAELERGSLGVVKQGVATANDPRFLRKFWESGNDIVWTPFAKGGEDASILPRVTHHVLWEQNGKEIRRYDGSRPQNTQHFFKGGATYTVAKEGARRFGYLHDSSTFGHKGSVAIPKGSPWELISYANSTVGAYLMLCQTPERMWEIGEVAKLPWDESLEGKDKLKDLSKAAAGDLLSLRQYDLNSPHYKIPLLLELIDHSALLSSHAQHPHRDLASRLETVSPSSHSEEETLRDLGIAASKFRERIRARLEERSEGIDSAVYQHFNISDEQREIIELEIALRTNEDPRQHSEHEPDSITEPPEDFSELIKQMLLHLTFEIVEDDDDGIVLLRAESEEEEADLMAQIQAKFEEIWGKYAEARLQEVDEVLGNREPTDEPYPNLRHWLENDLFAFHCDEFENTPTLWELTTERLGEDDNEDTGFACLIDYHQLGSDVFDRLSARYLETRKAALRERRQSARRTAEGTEGTQTREARQEEKRCENALRHIGELETRISELTQPKPREWGEAVQDDARALKPKVRRFRELFERRLSILDDLVEVAERDQLQNRYTDTFIDKVMENREDWMSTLDDLEEAFKQFAQPVDQPVEAHLYDLLPYYVDQTVGKLGHYTRNKILWAYHYFIDRGEDLAAEVKKGNVETISRQEKLVADLAMDTDEEVQLAREIKEGCDEMQSHMDSNWKSRALEEIRAPGYRPVKKHGVAINITPLAEKKLVPELVGEKVI